MPGGLRRVPRRLKPEAPFDQAQSEAVFFVTSGITTITLPDARQSDQRLSAAERSGSARKRVCAGTVDLLASPLCPQSCRGQNSQRSSRVGQNDGAAARRRRFAGRTRFVPDVFAGFGRAGPQLFRPLLFQFANLHGNDFSGIPAAVARPAGKRGRSGGGPRAVPAGSSELSAIAWPLVERTSTHFMTKCTPIWWAPRCPRVGRFPKADACGFRKAYQAQRSRYLGRLRTQ